MQQEELIPDNLNTDITVLDKMKESIHFIDFVQHSLIILNKDGIIVHANKAFLDLAGTADTCVLIGHEFGDIIKSADSNKFNPTNNPDSTCQDQNFERIFSTCLNSKHEVKEECSIIINENKIMDFLFIALPLNIKTRDFILLSMIDISEINWKATLERIFFHDILNSAGALKECLNLLNGKDIEGNNELLLISKKITDNLIDEIISHKQYLMAERNEYEPNITTFDCNEIMLDVYDKIRYSLLTGDKILQIIKSEHMEISSDKTLLSRVIFNLVKNALEATKTNGTVELYCLAKENKVEFMVRNLDVIPENIQTQIFNKSFSTKGTGRGLGIYSAKLITEKFLKGKVFFESAESIGTIFYAVYPSTIS
jgi:signal transduction histidine kinase